MKSKFARVPEKRVPGLLVMAVICIAMFLVAIWVLSAPSDSPSAYVSTSEKANSKSKAEDVYDEVAESEEKADAEDKVDDDKGDEKTPDADSADELTEAEKAGEPGDNEEKAEVDKTDSADVSEEDLQSQDKKIEDGIEQQEESDVDTEKVEDDSTDKEESTTETKDTDTIPTTVTDGEQLELAVENKETEKSSLITQAKESKEEKINEVIEKAGTIDEKAIVDEKEAVETDETKTNPDGTTAEETVEVADDGKSSWKVCTWEGAQDYIPCLDNKKAIKKLPSTKHFEHRERHCPVGKDLPTCLVPLPEGYKPRIDWPESRNQIWHANVPHDKLVTYKQDQNWVKKQGDLLVFPGGGTQFKFGALQYIDSIHKILPDITWGKSTRVVLDVGCGVASFGGYMFDRDALVMSFAPKDEHEAQVQMALERGIPGILSVMGTQRLVFPSNVFDAVHCARCRVPWYAAGGKLLLELNRVLRPGGYFVWSATPVYRRNDPDEVRIWEETIKVTEAMCWKLVIRTKADPETQIGFAVFQKPQENSCYEKRTTDEPPMCEVDDQPDAAWYVPMNSCLHRIPTGEGARAAEWPVEWPLRVETTPSWLKSVPKGIYGKPAAEEFVSDSEHWRNVIENSYLTNIGIRWSAIRNVMDMKAGYGGFAAALVSQPVWVMNVIPTDEPDTLTIIYDRGLFGLYHDWCESFSTYPRTYDLMHADHLFSGLKKRCNISDTLIEMDRILRPEGWAIFRETVDVMSEIEDIAKSLHWSIRYTYEEGKERLVAAQKRMWRPQSL
ncbi:protein MpPMT.6 [Marchantia polymorpha subsp. ruderalis]|uniref:Methyltransferase n=2 Tax=Marchantia polymorpha TaxID=3197 RepID=A0A176WJV7_MARPO|nr:hypothetical protein AXG93_3569s1100 [Marchantia polymorpha subsp. ruderalis]PTQ36648.1 hypothetical protein MARPO_0062s0067 [Marchantia polymorpha]BBN16233.1 hypothetical protein Mp_7g04590 [Marchantia polymorpha subsp. ruderalis]|eukprot:PTQ36648.1 hypothetical protein MARPO_0062s0067 [Marchantia polymorpha]